MSRLMESVPTEFDYFESKVIQSAITSEYDQEITPISTFQYGSPIEILIKASDHLYYDLNSSKLIVECKITAADGSAPANDANCGVANLTLHSLFKNIEMFINGQLITHPNNLYPYRAFIETILTYDDLISKTRLVCEGWCADTRGKFDDFSMAAGGANLGYKTRSTGFIASGVVKLIGRPHLDLFHSDKDLPPGCEIKLRLHPSASAFVAKRVANLNNALQMRIQNCTLLLRTKAVAPSLWTAHKAMLQKQNYRIPLNKVEMKTVSIPQGNTNITLDNLFTGVLPDRLSVLLIDDAHFQGAYIANPFLFTNADLSSIVLKVDGEIFPKVPYNPNFTDNKYVREYLALWEALGLDTGTRAINLTAQDWAESFPIFIFNLNPIGIPSAPRLGNARLDFQFRTATAAVLQAILYAEYQSVIEIDRDHHILLA